MNKKAVSVVIATLLLVLIVIIMAGLIFMFMNQITGKIIMLEGKNIQTVCNDVMFDADYADKIVYISNDGNVLIYRMEMIVYDDAGHYAKDLIDEQESGWPENGLGIGGAVSQKINIGDDVKKIVLVPILQGEADGKKELYNCGTSYGFELYLGN